MAAAVWTDAHRRQRRAAAKRARGGLGREAGPSRRRQRILAGLVALAALPQCGVPPRVRADRSPTPAPVAAQEVFAPAPDLQALIDPRPAPGRPSWLGGDVALSVRLTDDHYVWLFGDTLLGSVSTACPTRSSYCDRRVATDGGLIANSAGTLTRRLDGSFFPMAKWWRTEGGEPAPIFEAASPDEILWPLAAARVGTRLLVAATRQRRDLGLASLGGVFLVVENPEDAPKRWRYHRHPIPNEIPSAGLIPGASALSWTTALVARGPEVFVFGARGPPGESETVLARVRVADVLRPDWEPAPEYLVDRADGRVGWAPRFRPGRLHALEGLPGTSEATIRWEAARERWVTYRIPPLAFDVHRYAAARLLGPWRDEGVVYRLPPRWSASASPRFAAYAAREHPELSRPGERVVTYNVNVAFGTLCEAIEAIEAIDGFYVPRVIAGRPRGQRRTSPGRCAGRRDGFGAVRPARSCEAREAPNRRHGPGLGGMDGRCRDALPGRRLRAASAAGVPRPARPRRIQRSGPRAAARRGE